MLYLTGRGWRFAVYGEGGILDGGMPDVSTDDVPAAQSELVRRVEEWAELAYEAAWTADKPDWWSAELKQLPTGTR